MHRGVGGIGRDDLRRRDFRMMLPGPVAHGVQGTEITLRASGSQIRPGFRAAPGQRRANVQNFIFHACRCGFLKGEQRVPGEKFKVGFLHQSRGLTGTPERSTAQLAVAFRGHAFEQGIDVRLDLACRHSFPG